jgi:hypothetical protein
MRGLGGVRDSEMQNKINKIYLINYT